MRTPDRAIYQPKLPGQELANRKDKFAGLNKFVTHRGGWITSVPGALEVAIECLPGSTLPDELRAAGYDLRKDGEGERILPAAIVQEFTMSSYGAFEPLTPGSTKPVEVRRHAGIVAVMRFSFPI
jgi:hypothetical protein